MQEKLDQIIHAYQSGRLKVNDFRSQIAMFINEYTQIVVQQNIATRKNDFIEDAYMRICLKHESPDHKEVFRQATAMWNGLINEYRLEAEAIQKAQAEASASEPTPPENITSQGNNEPIEPSKVIKMKPKSKKQ